MAYALRPFSCHLKSIGYEGRWGRIYRDVVVFDVCGRPGCLNLEDAELALRHQRPIDLALCCRGRHHMPGEEAWLVDVKRSTDERKYDQSNLPVDASLKQLASVIKARWVLRASHQQM